MNALFSTLLLVIVSHAAAQCSTAQHPNCVNFVRNGYCNNLGYSLAQRVCNSFQVVPYTDKPRAASLVDCATPPDDRFKQECATETRIVPVVPTTRAAATDGNANCAKWATNPTNAFCVNTMTTAQKTLFCAKTCEFEIKPTADCALYTVTGTTFARGTPSNGTPAPGNAVPSGVVAGTTLNRVFAKNRCTVKLFDVANPPATNTGEAATFVGTATANFFPVAAANNGALSYTCVCAAA